MNERIHRCCVSRFIDFCKKLNSLINKKRGGGVKNIRICVDKASVLDHKISQKGLKLLTTLHAHEHFN